MKKSIRCIVIDDFYYEIERKIKIYFSTAFYTYNLIEKQNKKCIFNITYAEVYKVQTEKQVYRKQKYKCVKENTFYYLKDRESTS